MQHFFVDFETRSEADLKKVGTEHYARHETTKVLCLAYLLAEDDDPQIWYPGLPAPQQLIQAAKGGAIFHAYNAAFEHNIWSHVLVGHGFPDLAIDRWRCTMARASYAALARSLDGAAKCLELDTNKDMEGKRIMMKMCKPRKATTAEKKEAGYDKNKVLWHDEPENYEKLYEYCKQDVLVEREVYKATPAMPKYEQELWVLDQKINQRGVPIDIDFAKAAIETDKEYKKSLIPEFVELTDGKLNTPNQVAAIVKFLNERGVNIDSMKKEAVDEALETTTDPVCKRILDIRKEFAGVAVKKYKPMVSRPVDGRVMGEFRYHGAERTGRWAGNGIQFHNIARGSISKDCLMTAIDLINDIDVEGIEFIFGNVPETLKSCVRPAIKAPEGYEFHIADFAGIEARVLAWLAGEKETLAIFRDGRDIYLEMAAKIYERDSVGLVADYNRGDKTAKFQRAIGKVAILGLGYGMGYKKFKATLALFGIEVDDEFAKKVVDVYRETNSRIKNFWYDCERAALAALADGKSHRVGKVVFDMSSHWVRIRLPSGRRLHYPFAEMGDALTPWGEKKKQMSFMSNDVFITVDGKPKKKKWWRTRTYGGKLAENITQAVARDFLANSLFQLEARGHKTIMHVHDEVNVEAEIGKTHISEIEDIMRIRPAWGEDCPIGVEGFTWGRFRK